MGAVRRHLIPGRRSNQAVSLDQKPSSRRLDNATRNDTPWSASSLRLFRALRQPRCRPPGCGIEKPRRLLAAYLRRARTANTDDDPVPLRPAAR
jgi:hypothetical protein